MSLQAEQFSRQGLYDPSLEHESCGVGFIVNFKGKKSHRIVQEGVKILERMEHRGACGCEENTGDGAGMLIQIPHTFMTKVCQPLGVTLPDPGHYAVGMLFLPKNEDEAQHCKLVFEKYLQEASLDLLAWRLVPTDNSQLGPTALSQEPQVWQAIVQNPGLETQAFEAKLYLSSKQTEHEIADSQLLQKEYFFIVSLSSRTLVYKGLLTSWQLLGYFPDLQDEDLDSAMSIVHSRFATNTFPQWKLAHPYRYLAHNGEINTVKGNRNWMTTRQAAMQSADYGEEIKKLFPIISQAASDSLSLDNALELLYLTGRDLPHAMMMLIPEAWQGNPDMAAERRAFYEYHANIMEPWDGPACVSFTDGNQIGAILDRNGLRPARYVITEDDELIMASEVGVVDIDPEKVIFKGRLRPGRMLLADLSQGQVVPDAEIKARMVAAKPYSDWVKNVVDFSELSQSSDPVATFSEEKLFEQQRAFAYTNEDIRLLLTPMAQDGKEPIGSMGTDTPLAVLSEKSPNLFNYFKQLFAQVTNPPIDPIREELVMSHQAYLGPEDNLLDSSARHCRRIRLKQPILTHADLAKLKTIQEPGFQSESFSILFERDDDLAKLEYNLKHQLNELFAAVKKSIEAGVNLIILSDRGVSKDRVPMPSLLASAGLHHYLIREGLRGRCSIILESAEPREVHHFAVLFGYGVSAVNPYLALDVIENLDSQAQENYIQAINKGLYKIFSKMGISTLQSYTGAMIFEAIGLSQDLVDQYFTATVSRIEGAGLETLALEARERHDRAFNRDKTVERLELEVGGQYHYRLRGEKHAWNPQTIATMQRAVREKSYATFKEYSDLVNGSSRDLCTLRGLMKFKKTQSIPLDQVESAEEIVKRFATGAMSYGSISQEAHENLAIAMNRIGGKSNTGEGGENPERFTQRPNGDLARSAIKQVASGRFGVTTHYLVNSDEIQIKIAQGAKPGEGGQLPGHKVDKIIAEVRHSTPGVGLISPPPHHDIYSIEDLAQLIYDLKNVNPRARVTVKLVSEAGVGTIAAGVAKAHADMIVIAGFDGGTGASPLSSIKHAGLPWELGLAETQQILVAQKLRSRTAVQTDGQLKTGRDVAVAALLGAEEFGFATAPLIASGCIMMRKCHLNTCPVGIATQRPELRKKFQGTPEHVINYFFFIAEELREIMAELGFHRLADMVGRSDLLEMDEAIANWKAKSLDLSKIFYRVPEQEQSDCYNTTKQDHGLEKVIDHQLIAQSKAAIENKTPVSFEMPIRNIDRTTGAMLSGQIAQRYGAAGLPEATIQVKFNGSAGQSFGAFLSSGLEFELEGDANDYLGKGLFGGRIVVYPPKNSKFVPEENQIVGNVLLYGATQGEVFIRGLAGERFCVRNSGVHTVVEGIGDHGCEYMTGGRVIVLGEVGRNFAAGMSGGIAYIYDVQQSFENNCNQEMVDLDPLSSEDLTYIESMLNKQRDLTGSTVAQRMLKNWSTEQQHFIKVMPRDYKRVLAEAASESKVA